MPQRFLEPAGWALAAVAGWTSYMVSAGTFLLAWLHLPDWITDYVGSFIATYLGYLAAVAGKETVAYLKRRWQASRSKSKTQ